SKVIFLYNFRCRTRIAGGFMVRDYVTNQSKDNNEKAGCKSAFLLAYVLYYCLFTHYVVAYY
ncbi:hypothetical protein, partial [Veillonella sp.]|uniref:hypothetical protein n=1 Tax=Veillonella sp. TaxID=1926307 RepID=UPI00257FC63D